MNVSRCAGSDEQLCSLCDKSAFSVRCNGGGKADMPSGAGLQSECEVVLSAIIKSKLNEIM